MQSMKQRYDHYVIEPVKKSKSEFKSYWNEDGLNRVFVYLLVALLAFVVLNALLRDQNLSWFFESRCWTETGAISTNASLCFVGGGAQLGEIGIVLGPLFAIALAIERVVEILLMFTSGNTNRNIVSDFEQALTDLTTAAINKDKLDDEDIGRIQEKLDEQKRLFINQISPVLSQLGNHMQMSKKRKKAITFSFLLGLIVAVVTDIGLFLYLRIAVPRFIDLLITGFVLGAGAGPLHSFVGVLDSLKGLLSRDTTISTRVKSEDLQKSLRSMVSTETVVESDLSTQP